MWMSVTLRPRTEQENYTELLNACHIDDFSEEKRNKYDSDMYDEKRRKGEMKAAIEMGMAEGLAAGREEGREEEKRNNALKFKQLGVAIETISQATGLSVEEIEAL